MIIDECEQKHNRIWDAAKTNRDYAREDIYMEQKMKSNVRLHTRPVIVAG